MAAGLRSGGHPARPGRRGRRRVGAPQRPPGRAGPGAPRRGRHHLREPAQRHERRRRTLPQVGQRRPAPRLVVGARVQPGRSPRAAGRARQGRAARSTRSAWSRTPAGTSAVAFMQLDGIIDCLIPRGGPSLVASVREHATVPYVHRRGRQLPRLRRRGGRPRHGRGDRGQRQDPASRRLQRGRDPARAPGGGRATSCPGWPAALAGVELVGDAATRAARPGIGAATDEDFATEFLDLTLSVAVVDDLDAAIDHIARFGSGHSEAIVTTRPGGGHPLHRPRSTPPPWWSTPRPGSSTGRSSASGPRSASRPRSCTPGARWACASSPRSSTCVTGDGQVRT